MFHQNLIYHPVFDANHCIYRILLILKNSPLQEMDFSKIKIIDLHLLFPNFLKSFRFPRIGKAGQEAISALEEPYEAMPNSKRLFFDMSELHRISALFLIAKGIVDRDKYEINTLKLIEEKIPTALSKVLLEDPTQKKDWFKLVFEQMPRLPVDGKNGLKDRSNLMEFKYDS